MEALLDNMMTTPSAKIGESTAHRNRSGDLRRGGEPVGVSVKIGISDQVSDGIVVNIALADSSVVSGDTGAVPPDARTGDGQRLWAGARKGGPGQFVEGRPTDIELRVGDTQAGGCVEQ